MRPRVAEPTIGLTEVAFGYAGAPVVRDVTIAVGRKVRGEWAAPSIRRAVRGYSGLSGGAVRGYSGLWESCNGR